MKNICWLILPLCFVLACTQNSKQPEAKTENTAENNGFTFAFSSQTPPQNGNRADDWCHASLPEAAVINADPKNFNRRLFTLSNGPQRVTVDSGNNVAAFVLKKEGNRVEIFTSDNYPECLSNRKNFNLAPDGLSFHYDNLKHINFDVQLVPLPNGTQIALEMPADSGYGIIVRR